MVSLNVADDVVFGDDSAPVVGAAISVEAWDVCEDLRDAGENNDEAAELEDWSEMSLLDRDNGCACFCRPLGSSGLTKAPAIPARGFVDLGE